MTGHPPTTSPTGQAEITPGAAWRVVVVSAVAEFLIFGIRLSYQIFQSEFVNREGWSSQDAATVYSISMLVFALLSAPGGALLDRFGPRLVFSSGALLLALGLALSGFADNLAQLRLTYGVMGGAGLALIGLGPVAGNIAAFVPPERRGRAIGIAFAGTGFGSLVFIPLYTTVMSAFDWRATFLWQSAVSLIIIAPLLYFGLQDPPRRPGRLRYHSDRSQWRQLVRTPLFWIMLVVGLTALGPLRSLTVHQLAYLEQSGFARSTAAGYVGLAGLLTFLTYIGWGWVSDHWGRAVAFTGGGFGLGGAVAILFLVPHSPMPALLLGYAVCYALGEGTRSSQTTALASDLFQKYGLGLVNGLIGGMFGFGAAFGPWLVGRLRDQTGSYGAGWYIVLIMIVISLVGFVYVAAQRPHRSGSAD